MPRQQSDKAAGKTCLI